MYFRFKKRLKVNRPWRFVFNPKLAWENFCTKIISWMYRFYADKRGIFGVGFLVVFLIGVALSVIAVFLAPRPKLAEPEAARDLELPDVRPGDPVMVIFGTPRIKGLNVLHYADKFKNTYKVKA